MFFVRGLSALLPTLITISLLVYIWNFLWKYIGIHMMWVVKFIHYHLAGETAQWGRVDRFWDNQVHWFVAQLTGVTLAIVLVYFIGLLLGNLIGRTFWKLGETLVMKIPVIRAIYPAVKQVTDFFFTENKIKQLAGNRVVAIQPHENGIWSLGLITGSGPIQLNASAGEEFVTVFCPNSPAAFSGYVMVVPRRMLVELPMTVDDAMKLFVSGGVIMPDDQPKPNSASPAATPAPAAVTNTK